MKKGPLKQNTKGKENSTIRLMKMHKEHSNYKSKSTTSSLQIEILIDKSISLALKCANRWKNWNKRKQSLKNDGLKDNVCWPMRTLVPLKEKLQRNKWNRPDRALERINEDIEGEAEKLPLQRSCL